MEQALIDSAPVKTLLDRVAGLDQPGGEARTKAILRKIVGDLYATIDQFDVTPEEFWAALAFVQAAAPEYGLLAPGLGFEHFLDLRMDRKDRRDGIVGGTPRTIEGPLYVPGAPVERGFARLDDGGESGEPLIMHGQVRGIDGHPIAAAIVDVWHANAAGGYSGFDPSQSGYNNRRRIETDDEGRYKFRSIVPRGYAAPPGGSTERLLQKVGRPARRPAHIHFFVSAPDHRHLTTQINIDGDPDLYDDFAYATRDELIPAIARRDDPKAIEAEGLAAPFSEIVFDFVLLPARRASDAAIPPRPRVSADVIR